MTFSWAETRQAARQSVAETFALSGGYRADDNSPVVPIRARVHYKTIEVEDDGFVRADQEIWIWLLLADVPDPQIDAAIHIDSMDADFLVEKLMPATDVAAPVVVRAL